MLDLINEIVAYISNGSLSTYNIERYTDGYFVIGFKSGSDSNLIQKNINSFNSLFETTYIEVNKIISNKNNYFINMYIRITEDSDIQFIKNVMRLTRKL